MSETSKTGVYAVRAQEVVSIHQGELERQDFGMAGLLGLACVITCVFTSVLTTLFTGLSSGGPVLLLYGLIFAAAGALLIALSLGELASAFPTSRGPMQWTYEFAGLKYRRFLSYFVGQLNWLGYSVISAGFGVLCASQILGLAVLAHPDYVIKQWHTWIIAEGLLVLTTLFNVYGLRLMPTLDKITLYFFFFTFFVFLIVPVACANPTFATPKFVFTDFVNLTGWDSFAAFMIGLSGVTTAFGGTDAITHIAEEVLRPERDIPRTMWITVVIGFCSTFVLMISLLFAVKDFDSLLSTTTGQPYIQLVFDATGSFAGTACMAFLVIAIGILSLIGLVLTASRVAFTVARDGGLFSESYFGKVHPTLHVPVRALMLSSATSFALACTVLGSTTALNSFLNSVIVLNWICYSIPIIALLVAKRRYANPGPFQLGRFGSAINVLTVLYMCFQGIFFFLPYGLPAAVESMNYTCVVVVGLCTLVGISWFTGGRKYYLAAPITDDFRHTVSHDGKPEV